MDAGGAQVFTAVVAALTAVLNLLLVFIKRKLDPTAVQLLEMQFKEISKSNKRNSKILKQIARTMAEKR